MKKQEILIIGLGKIGSALVRNFCSKNFLVYGFDIKKDSGSGIEWVRLIGWISKGPILITLFSLIVLS